MKNLKHKRLKKTNIKLGQGSGVWRDGQKLRVLSSFPRDPTQTISHKHL